MWRAPVEKPRRRQAGPVDRCTQAYGRGRSAAPADRGSQRASDGRRVRDGEFGESRRRRRLPGPWAEIQEWAEHPIR
jgi:hypothetical protein